VKLVISDAHEGIKAAVSKGLCTTWQRCRRRRQNSPTDCFLILLFFGKLKQFKRIALRSDKTDTSFKAMICATAALINPR